MKRILALTFLLLSAQQASSCLIFIFADSKNIIIGNHEDWPARDARVRFIPGQGKELAVIAFDFASEGFIQGGMNAAGLFFDGTATPFVPLDFTGKEVFTGKDFWLSLLKSCSTIQQAIDFIQKYQVPELEKVHLFFADRTGQSVIVGAYDGELTFTWRSQPFQVLTNFNIVDPEYGGEQPCPRYATATRILSQPTRDPMSSAKTVLAETTQGELTVYSTLFNLTTGTVAIFYLADFSKSLTLDLSAEWQKGPHDILLSEAFR